MGTIVPTNAYIYSIVDKNEMQNKMLYTFLLGPYGRMGTY